jgi:DNA-directed RNA polymerase specialized sigma24 family protein
VEEAILALERENKLRITWSQLDERCRTLLQVLFFGPDQDYARMAKTLGMPIGSIGPTRMRCLKRLRKLLQKQGL